LIAVISFAQIVQAEKKSMLQKS